MLDFGVAFVGVGLFGADKVAVVERKVVGWGYEQLGWEMKELTTEEKEVRKGGGKGGVWTQVAVVSDRGRFFFGGVWEREERGERSRRGGMTRERVAVFSIAEGEILQVELSSLSVDSSAPLSKEIHSDPSPSPPPSFFLPFSLRAQHTHLSFLPSFLTDLSFAVFSSSLLRPTPSTKPSSFPSD